MNAQEIKKRIAALQNRASAIIITDTNKRNVQGIIDVIDMHLMDVDEILEYVIPESQERALTDLNKDIDSTEETLRWHENKWGTQIVTEEANASSYKVSTQDFQGNWTSATFVTKQDVFEYISTLDMVNKLEIEGVEQEGDILQPDELEVWLNS